MKKCNNSKDEGRPKGNGQPKNDSLRLGWVGWTSLVPTTYSLKTSVIISTFSIGRFLMPSKTPTKTLGHSNKHCLNVKSR